MKHLLRLCILSVFVLLLFAFTGCSGDDDNGPPMPTASDNQDTGSTDNTDQSSSVSISLTTSDTTILPEESITLRATVVDNTNAPMSGETVTFTRSNPALGALSDSSASTNDSGVATVTFTAAANASGTIAFTASSGNATSSRTSVTINEAPASDPPTSITFNIADDTVVMAGNTQVIQATLLDDSGIMDQGIAVSFSLGNTSLGSISTATNETNASGYAQTTFTASQNEGTVTLTAESGGFSESIDLVVMREQPATIQFVDVSRQILATRGSGGVDFTTVRFIVQDGSGNSLSNESVEMVILDGPGGGEYLGPVDSMSDVYEATTDAGGYASVILHSGYVAGPVTLQASITVDDVVVRAKPTIVSIGGGIVDDGRFNVVATVLNVYGLGWAGNETNVSAYLADRYGNYNILDGTMVNFMTEPGLSVYSSSALADENGIATAVVRTTGSSPMDVVQEDWETALKATIAGLTGTTMSGHPRDGVCSVLVYTNGEEHFYDEDANGIYEADIDTFDVADDTHDDPFCDYDDDGIYDGATGDNGIEDYYDWNHTGNSAGQWDGMNGACDVHKALFRNFRILLTGSPVILSGNNLSIAAGGGISVPVFVCDRNYNPLIPGTEVSFSIESFSGDSTDSANIIGQESFVVPVTQSATSSTDIQYAMINYSRYIADSRSDASEEEVVYLVTTVTWNGYEYSDYVRITLEAAAP